MSSSIAGTQDTSEITPRQKFKGHTDWISGVTHLPNRQWIVTCSHDNSLRVWNLENGEQIGEDWRDGESQVHSIALSPDGKKVVSGSDDHAVRLWDIDTGKVIAKWTGHMGEVISVCWSRDGRRVLSGSDDQTAMQWAVPVENGKAMPRLRAPTIMTAHTAVWAVVYSPDMTMFATGGRDRPFDGTYSIEIRNANTGKLVATLIGHTDSVRCLAWTKDGKTLISGSFDSSIRTWDTTNWKQTAVLEEHTDRVFAIAISPNDRILASASADKTAQLWNLENSQPIGSPIQHAEEVFCLSFSTDGKLLVTGCWDKNGYSWDVAVIVREAGLDDLLSDSKANKSSLNADATGIATTSTPSHPDAIIREKAIREAVWIELEYAPLRLLNTSTGLLCDRVAQLNAFKTSAEYKELLSFDSDLQIERIKEVVAMYFRCVLLSHRWEETEALLHDIKDKVVYELNGVGGVAKLQSFCKIARDAGYCWAWMDTCCIDKNSNTELQESVNSMFVWYRHSALTIVYLCDVHPSSQPGALARSVWNERGWTFQEFVAPKVVIFYRKDWSLYLDDRTPNHKESPAIMKELEGATGIDARALISFHPGMSDARRRLQWASSRITTLQEDIAYSLFGIFGVHLPVIYGEKKQNALGRLLQEIVARSGNITVLDWIGQPSEFNSCLPAFITSYTAPPRTLPSLSEDQIQTAIPSVRKNPAAVELSSKLYDWLDNTSAARFANCRLHLPCMAFRVTEVSLSYGPFQETQYEVKADGLRDLLVTTKEPIVQFSPTKPPQQTFVLVRPWDRALLELPDFADLLDDMESEGDYWTPPSSPSDESPSHSLVKQEVDDIESRALRLLVRLGQPFGAFLLARQHSGEYKRVASDRDIIAQVKDVASVRDLMDIRTIEIL